MWTLMHWNMKRSTMSISLFSITSHTCPSTIKRGYIFPVENILPAIILRMDGRHLNERLLKEDFTGHARDAYYHVFTPTNITNASNQLDNFTRESVPSIGWESRTWYEYIHDGWRWSDMESVTDDEHQVVTTMSESNSGLDLLSEAASRPDSSQTPVDLS